MAPEQVRGERTVGPAVDVFAMGCVLYECLAGHPPFVGAQVVSVLAKILFEEAPDITKWRPGLPQSVLDLLSRMLDKDPSRRLTSGVELLAAVRSVLSKEEVQNNEAAIFERPARVMSLRDDVQELLCVVLAMSGENATKEDATIQVAPRDGLEQRQKALLVALRGLSADCEFLVDGSLVAVLKKWSSAVDQAVQAAHAALLVAAHWPAARVVITTGRGLRPGDMPMGEVLDRAAKMLAKKDAVSGSDAKEGEILIDELTGGLIAQRFELHRQSDRLLLARERADLDATKALLGRATPCVGREPELLQLDHTLRHCIDDSQAKAVIIIGPPGSGKSRLRHEFLRRRSASKEDVLVLCARGSPLSMEAPFGLLSQLLRGMCGVLDGATATDNWTRFARRMGQHLPLERLPHLLPLLGMLAQLGETETGGDASHRRGPLAHLDPSQLHDRLQSALLELLTAECSARPVLLLIEDLHWGDVPTVRMLDVALRELAEFPFVVFVFARKEVDDRFPDLWQQRQRFRILLRGLGKRACEQLIREVLDVALTSEQEARIIAQAAGNALFLEELIRAFAEGKGDSSPDTVLAMLQARIGRLTSEVQMALCSASVFGSSFSSSGVAALAKARLDLDLPSALQELVEAEIISPQRDSRLTGDADFTFRHDLVRDAAYALLTDRDRVAGHFLAAQFLERSGHPEAALLAEHYRRGDAPQEAAVWYRRAAEQALAANELGAARERAQSAIDAGVKGEARGQLYSLQATAAYWLRDDRATQRYADLALSCLVKGSTEYYHAVAHFLVSSGRVKDWESVERTLSTVVAAETLPGAIAARALCLARVGYMFMMQGRPAQMKQIAEHLDQISRDVPVTESLSLAQVHHFRSGYAMSTGDLCGGIYHLEQTVASFERAGDHRNALMERNTLACNYVEVGDFQRAETIARLNLSACERAKLPASQTLALVILGYAQTFLPNREEEAQRTLSQAVEQSKQIKNRMHQGWAQAARARLLYLHGRFEEAAAEALQAAELTRHDAPTFAACPLGWLARSLVRLGRAAEALPYAEQAYANMKNLGGFMISPMIPPLARAEALLALGHTESAAQAIQSAKRRIMRLAERIADQEFRQRFLAHPEMAKTMSM